MTINCGRFSIVKQNAKWYVKLYGNLYHKAFRSMDDAYYWANNEDQRLNKYASKPIISSPVGLSNEEVDAWTRYFASTQSA